MKIAVLGIRGLPANYSGFETCANHTTLHWSENEHEVLVYCRKNRYKERPEHFGKVKLKYVGQLSSKSFETLSHTFLSILDLCFFQRDIKYIHLYNTGNAIFLPLLKLFGKKVIISVDGIEWKRDKWGKVAKSMYKTGEWFSIKLADDIIVDNKEIEDYYTNKYNKKTTLIAYGSKEVIADSVKAAQYLKANRLEAKKYYIFVGRLVPEKGVDKLIAAYKKLKTEYPLVIIGDDHSDSDYKRSLFDQQSDSIRLVGFKFGEEYEQLLSNALMYISASHLEGTSPSLLAAMGANVCSLVNGIPENKYTVEGSAYTFKENDYDDLAKVWQELIIDPDKITAMGNNGYSHVKKNYNWKKISEQYIDRFENL